MCEHEVHELAEDLLRVQALDHAVAHQSHHHVECVLVLYLHLNLLGLHLQENPLLAMLLKYHPPVRHHWQEYYEVHEV